MNDGPKIFNPDKARDASRKAVDDAGRAAAAAIHRAVEKQNDELDEVDDVAAFAKAEAIVEISDANLEQLVETVDKEMEAVEHVKMEINNLIWMYMPDNTTLKEADEISCKILHLILPHIC